MVGVPERDDARGNALVEFALCLPFFMIITAGLMNLGSILWQIQAVLDAARYGARTSANSSNFDAAPSFCANLRTRAQTNTTSYLSSAQTNIGPWWDPAAAATAVAEWSAPGQPDYIAVPYVTVTMRTGTAGDNCILCFENIVRRMQLVLSSSFAIEAGTCAP